MCIRDRFRCSAIFSSDNPLRYSVKIRLTVSVSFSWIAIPVSYTHLKYDDNTAYSAAYSPIGTNMLSVRHAVLNLSVFTVTSLILSSVTESFGVIFILRERLRNSFLKAPRPECCFSRGKARLLQPIILYYCII